MENDKHLQQILGNSTEGASLHFTDAVMKRVNSIASAGVQYQPLVSPKWQRVFVWSFGALVIAIFVLCLLIALSPLQIVNWLQSVELPQIDYHKVLIFIITFWVVYAVNTWLQKSWQPQRQRIKNSY